MQQHCSSLKIQETTPLAARQAVIPYAVPDNNYLAGALKWYAFGFDVIPLVPASKKPAVSWDEWLSTLSETKVKKFWAAHERHQLGFIVGESRVVFDTDSAQAIDALKALESKFGVQPLLVVKTTKGEHHYYGLASGAYAKQDSHNTSKNPERIDVKTGRSMVVLPPSTGKEVEVCKVNHASELSEVGQDFIDALFQHNGRVAPRKFQIVGKTEHETCDLSSPKLEAMKALMEYLDPDKSYWDWASTGMIVSHETGGSEAGYKLWDDWSKKGPEYPGERATRKKWGYFNPHHARPLTFATLRQRVDAEGHDATAIIAASDAEFAAISDDKGAE